MKIILASSNAGKLSEFKQFLSGAQLYLASDFLRDFAPEENGKTFAQNARIKALALWQSLHDKKDFCVLADDSGLCVEALDNAPGIYSARFGADFAGYFVNNDARNRAKLIAELERVGVDASRAKFVCALCFVSEGAEFCVEGECAGTIINKERGENGFGYDSLFIPDGFVNTFAELDGNLKNQLSHRANALKILKSKVDFL